MARIAHSIRAIPFAVLAATCITCFGSTAEAQLPTARLFSVYPSGGQKGHTVEVTLSGTDLDETTKLHFSHPGITAEAVTTPPGPLEKAPRPVANRFRVKVAAEAPTGFHELRAIGRFGISNPRTFVVGDLKEHMEAEPNNTATQALEIGVNSVANGRISPKADTDLYKVNLKKGERFIASCFADRIDSKLDAVLVLSDSLGRELGRSHNDLDKDPTLDYTAAEDSVYYLKVYDFLYRGDDQYFYRLLLRRGPHIDFVFPPVGIQGATSKFMVYGRNLPGSTPASGVSVSGRPLEQLPVEISLITSFESQVRGATIAPSQSSVDGMEYRLKTESGTSNPYRISFTTEAIQIEREPNNGSAEAQKISVPCEFVGQFYPAGDEDVVEFNAKTGEVYRVEVLSQRLGLPTDPQMVLQQVQRDKNGNETVKEIAALDDFGGNIGGNVYDTTTEDPVHQLTIPEDGSYRVVVRDLFNGSQSDPRRLYRLSIRPVRADYRLVAMPLFPAIDPDPKKYTPQLWTTFLRRGGSERIKVLAFRRDGFSDHIDVTIEGLPPDVRCSGATLKSGQNQATLVLTAAEDASEWAGEIRVVGRTQRDGEERIRYARAGTLVWPAVPNETGARSRLVKSLVLAVSGAEKQPFEVEVASNTVVETARAAKIKVPIRLKSRDGFGANVTVTARDLPANVAAKPITVDPKKGVAELELEVKNNAPIGQFTLQFEARSEFNYRRNPQAEESAQARQKEIEKIVNELTSKSESLKKDAEAKAKAAEDLTKKAKELNDKLAALQKEAKEAADQAQASATAKSEIDKQVNELAAKLTEAQKAKEVADGRAKSAVEANKPQKLKVEFPTLPVVLKITRSPLRLLVNAREVRVKQGFEIDVPVEVLRLYDFKGPVELSVEIPDAAKGLTLRAPTVPEGQSLAVLSASAGIESAVGKHLIKVKAKTKHNDQDVEESRSFNVIIEKYEAPSKAF